MRPIVTNVSWSLSVPNRLSRSFGLWTRVWRRSSGVETGSSGGSMNRGPQAAGCPKWGQKNFTKMCEKTHLQSTRMVFNSRRGHLRINTESIKTLGGWGLHLGRLHRSPGPVAALSKAPPPLSALRASSFSPWGQSNWGQPSYCWTRALQ